MLCAGIRCLAPRFVGRRLSTIVGDFAATHRNFLGGQTRFMSPERGVMQLASNAILNALWDLWAKVEGKPLWRLVADMTPEQLVGVIDFRYITDEITPEQALAMLKEKEKTKSQRLAAALEDRAVPGYNTSVGWLGLSDEEVEAGIKRAVDAGFKHFKLKVGQGLETDRKRLGMVRKVAGDDAVIMTDVNQLWDIDYAIEYMPQLADLRPWFIEEPTSPDDILGHAKIRAALKPHGIGVATGEHVNNRVMFKQLLQADALDAVQLDALRLSGVNEILAVCLLAAKFGVPVVCHAGGTGMPELCNHIAHFDYVAISGKQSILEYTDHCHEYFTHPAEFSNGHFHAPREPGYSTQLTDEAFAKFECPEGSFWKSDKGQAMLNDPWRGCAAEQTSPMK